MRAQTFRQQQIVGCARRIITTRGFENLTIAELAKEMGLTQGAIYRHFRSKKEIISLLIDDVERTLNEVIGQAGMPGEPERKLGAILSAHLSLAERRKGLSFIVINGTLSLRDKSLQRKMLRVIRGYLTKIQHVLLRGQAAGVFRKDLDTSVGSIAFFGLVQSMVTIWALGGFTYSFKKTDLRELALLYSNGVKS